MEPNGYQFPQIVISSGEKGGGRGARRRSASLFWQMVALLLWVYLLIRGASQNAVGASANSLWQGEWRRTHSVKGGLPK